MKVRSETLGLSQFIPSMISTIVSISHIFAHTLNSYYPCVFILKPGQFLHINKGRLHAFRKAGCDPVDPKDCHSHLREELIANGTIKPGGLAMLRSLHKKAVMMTNILVMALYIFFVVVIFVGADFMGQVFDETVNLIGNE